ncbi:uncharacterized protein K489DRAFT_383886 [Dissoconium aciculare CBS 342.82]|uniref:Something about silencing protein 4 domain-containing protein n=1 Tax=Dissoconium aciculare CBS 342.82 TaxID=1314786 RepID=A0A6J3LV48_9PEZI|nr:uncharacterized protein K489DRAFT_383886 [Dissoconium aciculare CBS 342.82]KAF1819640.1 hypothetical protein K489DRAFT_383886 [Dissoconium aciculare CBS 342.82]
MSQQMHFGRTVGSLLATSSRDEQSLNAPAGMPDDRRRESQRATPHHEYQQHTDASASQQNYTGNGERENGDAFPPRLIPLAPQKANPVDSTADAANQPNGDRPPKRLKLSLRAKSNTGTLLTSTTGGQTTLDGFIRSQPLEKKNPPATEPTGKLPRLSNGTRGVAPTADHDEDELLKPTPMPTGKASRRTTQSPQVESAPRSQKPDEKRTLRSQDDGPRLKSELAVYFANYEDIMFDAPREEELITVDTTLYVTDDTHKAGSVGDSPNKSRGSTKGSPIAHKGRKSSLNGVLSSPTSARSIASQYNGSSSLSLDVIAKTLPEDPEDPLTDAHFMKSHKRAERREKQLRNIERDRAMHEKVQLDRLLDGLQGHDWLKVLGITGITDGEARRYELKRDYFISEVQTLVNKFKQWKEQERKQRLEKEAAAAAAEEAAREAEEADDSSCEGSVEPPSSDLNASAAHQLQQETANALRISTGKLSRQGSHKLKSRAKERLSLPAHLHTPAPSSSKRHAITPATTSRLPNSTPTIILRPPAPPSPEIPITSFYAKRHLRDAALGNSRHAGRNVTAFGLPLPEALLSEERDFQLPDDYVTEENLKANARERRRRRRETAGKKSE